MSLQHSGRPVPGLGQLAVGDHFLVHHDRAPVRSLSGRLVDDGSDVQDH